MAKDKLIRCQDELQDTIVRSANLIARFFIGKISHQFFRKGLWKSSPGFKDSSGADRLIKASS
jgi:hypothetical protein